MKKQNERRIFDLTYPQFQSIEVAPSESPDFMCYSNGAPILGVEVTELFRNEGYARLNKIPEYTLQLIDNKAYRHKDDEKLIRVEKIRGCPR